MFEKFVTRFIDDLTKTTDILYNVYNRLLNFELGCLDINLIGFVSFFGFYRTKSLITIIMTIFRAETTKNVLNNKSIVCAIGF